MPARLAFLAALLLAAGAAAAQSAPSAQFTGSGQSAADAPRRIAVVTAQRIAFAGSMGDRALLVIDGAAPRALPVGGTLKGVKLLSVSGGEAVVEVEGRRETLILGAAAVHVGGAPGAAGGDRITLASDAAGHFQTAGQINGKPVSFLVDTGATLIAMGQADAERLGLTYRNGRRVGLRTANGDTVGWRIALDSVRIGDVEVFNVEAVVQPAPMPFILLGNSFLTRFSMRRDHDVLTLQRRF